MTLARGGTGTVLLTAGGGAVSWTAAPDPYVALSATSGTLADGDSVPVTVTLSPSTPRGTTLQEVVFGPGSVTLTIAVAP